MVNPMAGHEAEITVTTAAEPKKVLVAGGGPAGLTAARIAALRGHRVTLYEKEAQLGGQIPLASALRERAEFLTMIRSFEALAKEAGVVFHMNQAVDPSLVAAEKPDVVIAATGGQPIPAPFPGGNLPHVVQAWDVLADRVTTGHRVVIVGGGAVGCEVALYLAAVGALSPEELHFLFLNQAETPEVLYQLASRGGKDISLLEMTGRVGSDIGQSTGWIIRQDLARAQIRIMTQTMALEIVPEGIKVQKHDDTAVLPADTVVLAMGTRPDTSLADALAATHPRVLKVGDASRSAKAYDAVHDAFRLALEL
jgi:2,4-dienoyl-CoA reductase (NADPH2)